MRTRVNRNTVGLVTAAIVATAVALVPNAHATGQDEPHLAFSGDCPVDVIFPIPVDVERARAFVRERYTFPTSATGKALMFVTLVACDDTVVDGVAAGPAIYNDLLFQIDTPPGGRTAADGHYLDGYWSWLVTNEPAVHEGLDRLGMYHGFDTEMSVSTTRTAGGRILTVDGTVSWPHSPFRIHGTVLNASPQGFPPDYEVGFWQDVPGGVLEARLDKAGERWRGARLTLTTPVDSPLADVLGDQCRAERDAATCSASGVGAVTDLGHFEHDITVRSAPNPSGLLQLRRTLSGP